MRTHSYCRTESLRPEGEFRGRRIGDRPAWKKHFTSRKWTAGVVGTCCVLFVFSATLVAVCLVSAHKAQALVATANIALVALGAITGSLITGQSFVDWRHGSQSQFAVESAIPNGEFASEGSTPIYPPKHYDEDGI